MRASTGSRAGVGEPRGDHPGADPEPAEALVQVAGATHSTRPWSTGRSILEDAPTTSPLEAIAITTTRFGCRRSTSTRWIVVVAAELRRRRHRDQVGDLGERRRRLPHRLVDLAAQLREPQLDPSLPGRLARFQQQVDITPVAGVGRDAAGRGVRMGQVALRLEQRQLRPHRRGPPLDPRHLGDFFRGHGPRRREIGIDDQLENEFLPLR